MEKNADPGRICRLVRGQYFSHVKNIKDTKFSHFPKCDSKHKPNFGRDSEEVTPTRLSLTDCGKPLE